MSRERERERDSTQVYISGFSSRTDKYDIKDSFKKFGKIEEVQFKNKYAFVRYYDSRDADDAVRAMHRQYLGKYDSHRLTVEPAGGPRREKKPGARGPQQEDECWYCKKKGHWKNECRLFFSERGRYGGGYGGRRRYSDSRSISRDRYRRRYSRSYSSSSSSRSRSRRSNDRDRRRRRSYSSSSSSSSSRSSSKSSSGSSRSGSSSSSSASRSPSKSNK